MTVIIPKKSPGDHLPTRTVKIKARAQAAWTIFIFSLEVGSVVSKLLFERMIRHRYFGKIPTSEDVYVIAKQFIIPTLKYPNYIFPDTQHQFGKRPDLVFVIRSSVDSDTDQGYKITTYFRMVLRYKGGQFDVKNNWTMMDLSEN